eukprot:Awhi_evm1s5967
MNSQITSAYFQEYDTLNAELLTLHSAPATFTNCKQQVESSNLELVKEKELFDKYEDKKRKHQKKLQKLEGGRGLKNLFVIGEHERNSITHANQLKNAERLHEENSCKFDEAQIHYNRHQQLTTTTTNMFNNVVDHAPPNNVLLNINAQLNTKTNELDSINQCISLVNNIRGCYETASHHFKKALRHEKWASYENCNTRVDAMWDDGFDCEMDQYQRDRDMKIACREAQAGTQSIIRGLSQINHTLESRDPTLCSTLRMVPQTFLARGNFGNDLFMDSYMGQFGGMWNANMNGRRIRENMQQIRECLNLIQTQIMSMNGFVSRQRNLESDVKHQMNQLQGEQVRVRKEVFESIKQYTLSMNNISYNNNNNYNNNHNMQDQDINNLPPYQEQAY